MHFKRLTLSILFLVLIMFCQYCVGQTEENDNLKSSAAFAIERLVKNFNKDSTWWTLRSYDTIPANFKKEKNFFVGMLIADLMEPLRSNKQVDFVINRVLEYSFTHINPENGFLRYYDRNNYPEDSDDTGLFWYLKDSVDIEFATVVIDSLEQYKSSDGLYRVWLSKINKRNSRIIKSKINEVDIIPNIHLSLFLSKYNKVLAGEICKSLQSENVISNPEYWVYYERAPWLYYIRQADMVKYGCELPENLPDFVTSLSGQEYYEQMAKFVRDIFLNDTKVLSDIEILELLDLLSKNNFEYLHKNPMLLYHGDLDSHALAFYWSYDMPYALWLRLYHEYMENINQY